MGGLGSWHDAVVRVVLVNHNTSRYAELALRSLLRLNADVDLDVTIVDNASVDDTAPLSSWAAAHGIAIRPSGFTTESAANTHGEVLRTFVLDSPAVDSFLFLDADACFLEPGTVRQMQDRLTASADLFAVQAEMRLFVTEALGLHPRRPDHLVGADGSRRRLFDRPHPFCLLVRDSAPFRAVVEHIGLSTATRHAASPDLAGSYDTFGLAAAAMRTHGQDWVVAGGPVLHYTQAAERRDPEDLMKLKDEDCARRLAAFRDAPARDGRPPPPPPIFG